MYRIQEAGLGQKGLGQKVNRKSQVHCRLCVRGSEAEEGVEAGDGEERMSVQEPTKLRLDLVG